MLKRTIGLGLLCMASHAYSANIVVNTTEDEFDDKTANETCSLREAIELINRADVNGIIPEEGFGGCSGKNASPSIVLEAGKTYTINKQLEIKRSLSINILDEYGNATRVNGENNATIQAKGAHRILLIDDKNPNIANLTVTISQVDLEGCGLVTKDSACDTYGGLIFNRENLTMSYARLKGGIASIGGGAIYNEGVVEPGSSSSFAGQLTLSDVYIHNNKANQGGAIFSVQPRYAITNSVIRDNEATDNNEGTVIYVSQPGEVSSEGSGAKTANITNSTIFANKGQVINLLDGMTINNSTIIKNTAGVYLNSANGVANLANSIVAENGSSDCIVAKTNKAVTNNLVYKNASSAGDCRATQDAGNPNTQLAAGTRLIANADIGDKQLEGKCDKPPKDGLLCPFHEEKEIFNGFFKPRLLTSYKKLSESPIINKGNTVKENNSSQTQVLTCATSDQRRVTRESAFLCDIGAIELIIEDKGKVGQDIKFGQTAEIDLTDYLGDGQLWPKQLCNDVFEDFSHPPAPPEGGWQDGCLQVVRDMGEKKGDLFLSSEGLLNYVPFRNYHGSDNFTVKLVTTTSRFSQADNDQVVTLRGTIVQEPDNTFENKSVKVSGGSAGLLGLFGMLGLVWIRRRLQGEK
ncbi:rhombotarget A [Alkanindiges sp. WGS2144]|uniref:rhombotarget A n=1 Tax=Alkanindiges sp. WGS2144 TaxID=3366808 RepID=UPI00375039F6